MWGNREWRARQRPRWLGDDHESVLGAAKRRLGLGEPQAASEAPAAGEGLTSKRRNPTMRSSRQDKMRGAIDRMAGRIVEAWGRLTGNRSARLKGRGARFRGAGRSAKGRLKRHAH
jgi:uncharacterized protein YjbJ (UPF0337 family)